MKYLDQSKATRTFVTVSYRGAQVLLHKPAAQHGVAIEAPACALRGIDWQFESVTPDQLMTQDYRPCKKCKARAPLYFAVGVASYRWEF